MDRTEREGQETSAFFVISSHHVTCCTLIVPVQKRILRASGGAGRLTGSPGHTAPLSWPLCCVVLCFNLHAPSRGRARMSAVVLCGPCFEIANSHIHGPTRITQKRSHICEKQRRALSLHRPTSAHVGRPIRATSALHKASGLVHAAARRVASFSLLSAASARFTARTNAASAATAKATAASATAAFCCPPATPEVAGCAEAARIEFDNPSRGDGAGRRGVGRVDRGGSGGGSGRPSRAMSALGMASGLVHAADPPATRATLGFVVTPHVMGVYYSTVQSAVVHTN